METTVELPAEVIEQLKIIDATMLNTKKLIVADILDLYAITIERKKLLCSVIDGEDCACLPDPFPFKATSGVIATSATKAFVDIAATVAATPSATCQEQQAKDTSYFISLLGLIASAMGFCELLKEENVANNEVLISEIPPV